MNRAGTVVVSLEEEALIPKTLDVIRVEDPYPNPAIGTVSISVSLDKRTFVTVEVYSLLGKKLMTVVSETFSPGTRLVEWSMLGHPTGTYFVVVTDENSTKSFPISLVR